MQKALKDVNKVDVIEVEEKLTKIKELGNQKYGQKAYKEAIAKFSEGIEIFMKDTDTLKKSKDVKLKVI